MAVSEDGKRAIARELAFGIDKAHVARIRGLTTSGITSMMASPEMQSLIRSERELLQTRMAIAMIHLNDQVEQSVKNVVAIANDLEHKDSYRANTDIIAMFRPPKQESDTKVAINLDSEAVGMIVTELAKIQQVHIKFDPGHRLLTGDEARVKAFGGATAESKMIDALGVRNAIDE